MSRTVSTPGSRSVGVTDADLPPTARGGALGAVITVVTLLLVCLAAAYADPTGLLAPLPWSALQVTPVRGLWSVAGAAVFLPVLVAVTAWATVVAFRSAAPETRRGRIVLRLWGGTVLATAIARLAQLLAETAGVGIHGGARTLAATALWDCGLTAERTALISWLPALLGALAYRPRFAAGDPDFTPVRRSRTLPPRYGWRWSLTGTALPLALLGPLLGPLLWEGSPAAAFYGEPLSLRRMPFGFDLGPARFAVELGTAAIVTAVLLTRSCRRFDYTRPRHLLLGGWLAALGGGLAAGAVQALLALPRDLGWSSAGGGTGGDLFFVPDVALRLGTGLSLGAAFGWAVVPTLLLLSRLLEMISGQRRRMATVLASATVLAVGSWLLAQATPVTTAAAPTVNAAALATAAQPLPALTVRPASGSAPAEITDVNGRQLLLRGVNVNQLVDYAPPTPGAPTVRPLTDGDFAQMASLGFDVVRLDISWSALEPTRGQYEQAYLARIRATVAMAAKHGLYTELDMHEDAWGPAVAAPPGTSCPSGSTPALGYDGAPAWATVTDGASSCQTLSRDLTPANARAFTAFYHDVNGIQSELVSTWGMLAQTFAGDPAVAGYGLLNEPGIGDDPPATSSMLLGAYYDHAVQAIRSAERQTPGGFPHLVLIEPSVLWSGLGFDAAPPRGFSTDPYLVFAPHLYNQSITMDQQFGLTLVSVERGFTLAEQQAKSYGMPLWVGEWGWFGSNTPENGAMMRRFAAAEDEAGIGDAFWVWKQACGSPESDPHAATAGNLIGEDCVTGKDLPPAGDVVSVLSRPYPQAAPGTLTGLSSDPDTGALTLTGTAPASTSAASSASASSPACTLTVWYPGRTRPSTPQTQGISQLTLRQVPGGWFITGCATGSYRLSVG
ncbi:hypothetical protein ABH940_005650 [Streptacidiphilus sp. BW17]|uniref:cellulase family glycosylhydrolase n=1 Tax=Streptacidiphilus sp. BW17 TaxID=3156274 RepID=UPI0035110F54